MCVAMLGQIKRKINISNNSLWSHLAGQRTAAVSYDNRIIVQRPVSHLEQILHPIPHPVLHVFNTEKLFLLDPECFIFGIT